MESTPRGLLERFRLQPADSDAWQELVEIYRPWLLSWLQAERLQETDAEDVLQDVLIVLYRQLPGFRHNGNTGAFRVWLRRIMVNRLFEQRRKRRHDIRWPEDFEDRLHQLEDNASDMSRIWDREHDRFVLQGLLAYVAGDFEPESWEAFRAYVIERKSATEVAEQIGITRANVFTIKSRVMKRLREVAKEIYPSN